MGKGSANNPIDVRELMRENKQLKAKHPIRIVLTFLFGAACMTTGMVIEHGETTAPATCDRNHVEYNSQGRPVFTEWCDFENGRCYIIIDGKKVIQKYKCKHEKQIQKNS